MLRRLVQPNLIRRAVAIAIGGGWHVSTGFSAASGVRAVRAVVTDTTMITVYFSGCVEISGTAGIEYQINGGTWTAVTAYSGSPGTLISFTVGTIAEADTVNLRYVSGSGTVVTCGDAEELTDWTLAVSNPLDMTAPTIVLADVGDTGANIIRIMFSEAVQTSNLTAGWTVTIDGTPHVPIYVNSSFPRYLYLVLGEYVFTGDVVTVSYNSTPGDVTDVTGYPTLNDLASVANYAVQNDVTVGPDIEPPIVTAFVVNGGYATTYDAEVSIDTWTTIDNVTPEASLDYQLNLVPATPPSPADPGWVPYGSRPTTFTLPGFGVHTLTAYAKDAADNVSRGLSSAQFAINYADASVWTPLDLFAGGKRGAWYDPSDLSLMWQDAGGVVPVTAAGQPVGRIADKSGNGNHAIQADTTKRPIYRTSSGVHWLEFDGVNDSLYNENLVDLSNGNRVSVFAGIANAKTASVGTVLEFSPNYLNNHGGFAFQVPSLDVQSYGFGSNGSLGGGEKQTPEAPVGDLARQVLVAAQNYDTANDYGCDYIRLGGTPIANLVGSGNTAVGTGPFGNFTGYIGARNNGTTNTFQGQMFSLIFVGEMFLEETLALAEAWIAAAITAMPRATMLLESGTVDRFLLESGADDLALEY